MQDLRRFQITITWELKRRRLLMFCTVGTSSPESCRILIFFVTEPDLVGQLKLIVWSTKPVGLHWLHMTCVLLEPVKWMDRHAPRRDFTLTISKSQPRRWNLTSTSTALQTVVGRLAAVRANRGIKLGAFFWNYLMACLTNRLGSLCLMLWF